MQFFPFFLLGLWGPKAGTRKGKPEAVITILRSSKKNILNHYQSRKKPSAVVKSGQNMDTLCSSIACLPTCSSSNKSPFARLLPSCPLKPLRKRQPLTVLVLRASSSPVRELIEDDVLQMFLKERELSGDFISKASDMFWQKEVMKFADSEGDKLPDSPQEAEEVTGSDNNGGFLKLTTTQEWILGDNSPPMNRKAIDKAMKDDSERRKKLNLLKYEALKRELMLLSVGIGTACGGYCLIALSAQAAISYAIGVLFSCVYLRLLFRYSDNLSKEMVPQIFMQKKSKKIGIRSEDLRDSLERSIKGSSIALSSPRLVIPAAIYGLWVVSHQYLSNEFFDFQIVPAMFGMFVYKAAALFQVYRDNEDLQFIFPENE